MIGNHDPSLGHRPIPVMSDADVLFMTQLSNDIARGVGDISAVRHHDQRARKRKARDVIPISGPGSQHGVEDDRVVRPLLAKAQSSHHRSRGSRTERTSASKRLHVSYVIFAPFAEPLLAFSRSFTLRFILDDYQN